ncbi:MAG: hypothetical protein ACPGQL_03850 [Thermoplasmatota archaeon]
MAGRKHSKIFSAAVVGSLVGAGILLLAMPTQAVVFDAPLYEQDTQSIMGRLTFQEDDLIPITAIMLILECDSGTYIDRFDVDGTAQPGNTHTSGDAEVRGPLTRHGYGYGYGYLGGTQSGYGFDPVGGYGTPGGYTTFTGYGYGYGYGYVDGAADQFLKYRFFLDKTAFGLDETCFAVVAFETPLTGDFQSPRTEFIACLSGDPTLPPPSDPTVPGPGSAPSDPSTGAGAGTGDPSDDDRGTGSGSDDGRGGLGGGVGGGTGPIDLTPIFYPGYGLDTDHDGIPDVLELSLGSDMNDYNSRPDFTVHDLEVIRANGINHLIWSAPEDVPGLLGYQIWADDGDGYKLLANSGIKTQGFAHSKGDMDTVYRVTFYVGNSVPEGFVAAMDELRLQPGWNGDDGVQPTPGTAPATVTTPAATPSSGFSWLLALAAVGALVVVVAVGAAMRRRW